MRQVIWALLLIVCVGSNAFAQEQQRLANVLITDRIELGAAVPFIMEGTTADGFEFFMRVDPTEDVTWNLPAAGGTAGQQLQTSGGANSTLSWASAGSTRDVKIMAGLLAPRDALAAVLAAPVHRFKYKAGMGTQDSTTEYAGIVADEAPWAMHFGGTILNPVNTAGYSFAAIQALQAEIEALKAQMAAQRPQRRWWQFWR